MKQLQRIVFVVCAFALSCASTPTAAPPPAEPSSPTVASGGERNPATGHTADAPEISRSLGSEGAILILWPRISPNHDDAQLRTLAASLQQALRARAEHALPGRTIEVRPEPERVCPRQGCSAMTLGAVLTRTGRNGCAVVATVSPAGASPARLVPWIGAVRLRSETVPFREPPEVQIAVTDYAGCDSLTEHLDESAEALEAAIRTAAPPQ